VLGPAFHNHFLAVDEKGANRESNIFHNVCDIGSIGFFIKAFLLA
jgi:hypothetical protein